MKKFMRDVLQITAGILGADLVLWMIANMKMIGTGLVSIANSPLSLPICFLIIVILITYPFPRNFK